MSKKHPFFVKKEDPVVKKEHPVVKKEHPVVKIFERFKSRNPGTNKVAFFDNWVLFFDKKWMFFRLRQNIGRDTKKKFLF